MERQQDKQDSKKGIQSDIQDTFKLKISMTKCPTSKTKSKKGKDDQRFWYMTFDKATFKIIFKINWISGSVVTLFMVHVAHFLSVYSLLPDHLSFCVSVHPIEGPWWICVLFWVRVQHTHTHTHAHRCRAWKKQSSFPLGSRQSLGRERVITNEDKEGEKWRK